MLRKSEVREYLLIQNTSAVNALYVGIGYSPQSGNALIISPGGSFEPFIPPNNDIFVFGSGSDTSGIMMIGLSHGR